MRNVSAGFLDALANGGQMVTRVQIYTFSAPSTVAGTLLADTMAADGPTPKITDGEIVVDATAAIRRRLDNLTIVDESGEWIPDNASDIFSDVSGNEAKVWCGFMIDGEPEIYEQGYFDLSESEVMDDSGGLRIVINGYDRARKVGRYKLTAPEIISNNRESDLAIQDLIGHRLPGTDFLTTGTSHLQPYQVIDVGSDSWAEAMAIAESIGYEIFFDQYARCIIRPVPDANDPSKLVSVYDYIEGASCQIVSLGRSSSNEDTPSGVIVTGANTYNITPPRGEAWDDDPLSPTYYLGSYGKVPQFEQSDKVTTNAQAADMAAGILRKNKGGTEIIRLNVTPNPALEDDDVLHVTRSRSRVDFDLVLQGWTLPLKAEGAPQMPLTTMKRRVQV